MLDYLIDYLLKENQGIKIESMPKNTARQKESISFSLQHKRC